MKIADVYVPDLRTCSQLESLPDAAKEMADAEIGALAVIDEAHDLVGIISERDLVLALADEDDPGSVSVGQYTTANVETARLDEESSDVARRMLDAGIRHLPVVEHDRVVGMISMRDLLALETWV
jgi:CBS domain-containing protein